ncbi:PKD domain-containing protein, partial [Chloroflexota bacterium]
MLLIIPTITGIKANFNSLETVTLDRDTGVISIKFVNRSLRATSYIWDFGDGTDSKDDNPEHEYNKNGQYRILLTAINGNRSDTYERVITVLLPPPHINN